MNNRFIQNVAAEALKRLEDELELWREKLAKLAAGQAMDRSEANTALGHLLDASQNLRDTIFSMANTANWSTREELAGLVAQMDDLAKNRTRYERLAKFLESGTVTYRRERVREESLKLRDRAVAELREFYELPSPPYSRARKSKDG